MSTISVINKHIFFEMSTSVDKYVTAKSATNGYKTNIATHTMV